MSKTPRNYVVTVMLRPNQHVPAYEEEEIRVTAYTADDAITQAKLKAASMGFCSVSDVRPDVKASARS